MSNDEVRPGRLLGCESANHKICYGELWQCSQCGKTVCAAEGSDDDPELCDDCWYVKHKGDPDIQLVECAAKRGHPRPTTPVPDLTTIEEWLWDEGGCEATDSCWVEVDGTCPHGHPSWLLKLGLI